VVMAASRDREAAIEWLRPFQERARGFSGWSFDLREHALGPPQPWSYDEHVRGFTRGVSAMLVIGTGGGERLAVLRDALPARVVATEEWPVNAPVARARLEPLGVDVVHASDEVPPFVTNSFDLVINRHSSFDSAEVVRVLRPGGAFLTQQVGRGNWDELIPHFPRLHDGGNQLGVYSDAFRSLGFNVTLHEHRQRVAYPSLGEFVYMLAVASWTIPDFDVERDIEALLDLEQNCLIDEGFVVTEDRYLLTARKHAY
jgi:SAM-dependent methyltransferase